MGETDRIRRESSAAPGQKPLSNRLVALVSVILLVSAVSLVTRLARVDASEYRNDLDALGILDSAPLPVDVAGPGRPVKSQYDTYAAWLLTHKPELAEKGYKARKAVVDDLMSRGVAGDLRGYMAVNPDRFTTSEYILSDVELKRVTVTDWHFQVKRAPTVSDRIDLLNVLYKPRTCRAMTAVHVPPNFPPDAESLRVTSFELEGHNLRVGSRGSDPVGRAGISRIESIVYPVDVEEIEGCPTIGELIGGLTQDHQSLHDDAARQAHLREIYGPLHINDAKTIASEQAVRTYRQVDILGLSFSTRRLPFAVASFLVLAMLGVFLTTRAAAVRHLPIVSGATEDSVLGMVVESPWARTVTLVILPALAVWAGLPPFFLTATEYILLTLIGLIAFGLGAASLVYARRL